MSDNKKEMVNHPSHYQGNKFEVIDIIEDFNLDFHLGNVIKYVLRCGKKDDDIQELKKAKWYLDKKIEFLETQKEQQKVKNTVSCNDGTTGTFWDTYINTDGRF